MGSTRATLRQAREIKGKKRHLLVDTQGLLPLANVRSAGVQDRGGGVALPAMLFGRCPFLEKLFADSAYQGPVFADALGKIMPRLDIGIVKKPCCRATKASCGI